MEQFDAERKIIERIDPVAAKAVALSKDAGGIGFSNMAEAMEFSKIMAISQHAIPRHLRGNPGACMAIIIQSIEWKMSPFAVANKSYMVNDRMAYESSLIQAVVLLRAPVKGRFAFTFSGDGPSLQCTATVALIEGGEVSVTTPEIGKIPIQNSPLWKNDPKQQLTYYAGRALCRRYFPDVLLGIFTPEELYEEAHRTDTPYTYTRDVTPPPPPEPPPEPAENLDDVISDAMAEEAQRRTAEALADPSGEQAGKVLADKLEKRARRKHT